VAFSMMATVSSPAYFAIAVVLVARSFLAWGRFSRPTVRRDEGDAETSSQPHDRNDFDYWDVPAIEEGDRRQKIRRDSAPTPVHYRFPNAEKISKACVLDRSSAGLRLAIEEPIAPGTYILLMADQSPPGTPWVESTVSWCRVVEDCHEIGCQFVGDVPWNVLLLFG
jgi:hypothetical protein